jgi:RNA polymerase sigma-70 factor (ECF subfamily)
VLSPSEERLSGIVALLDRVYFWPLKAVSTKSELEKGARIYMATLERTNEQWITDLSTTGSDREGALSDLGEVIRRGLPYSLSKYLSPQDPNFNALADEVVQDTLLRVLDNLSSFEGRSKFTTWVHKIAVRIALTELRRKRWQDVSLDEIVENYEASASVRMMADSAVSPEGAVEQINMVERIENIVAEELTERQRTALLAIAVQEMPMPVVADRLGMNRNALYKLLHDARLKLKTRLADEGLDPVEILADFEDS